MPSTVQRIGLVVGVVAGLWGLAAYIQHLKALDRLPQHNLTFGGDLILGRRVNIALLDDGLRGEMLEDLEPLLRNADLTLVNGEGVISGGGAFFDKGESRPYMYRAHPTAVDLLAELGVDIVTVGNNHSMDYGPDALSEMLDRIQLAGMDYTGGGRNLEDARRGALFQVEDTVVAVVGADLTYTRRFGARADRPGTLYFPGFDASKEDEVVQGLVQALEQAQQHAHLVFLTPHWGDNFEDQP
ncbi:MAG: CapA family protein, partial [Myxococcota bacterium]|nr:CapA family protein [Myxococcota bacterium]